MRQENMNRIEDKMLIDAVDELEQHKLKFPSRHSCSEMSDVNLMKNNIFEASSKSPHCTSSAQHVISRCDKPVTLEPTSVATRSRQRHRRADSGFFDIGEQQDSGSVTNSESTLKHLDRTTSTFSSSSSLLEPDNRSTFGSDSAFAQKESSDEESDSLRSGVGSAMSSDEQFGQELNIDGTEIKISSTHHSPSFASGKHTATEAVDHLHHAVSSPQFFSDVFGSTPVLLPLPDSSSPLMSNYAKLCNFAESPMENSKNIKNANNPYVSPPLACDDLLRKLCPVYLLVSLRYFVCHL